MQLGLTYMTPYLDKHRFTGPLFDLPEFVPDMIVCLPVLNEPRLIRTLESLAQAKANYPYNVLILILFNHSATADQAVKESNQAAYLHFAQAIRPMVNPRFSIQAHLLALPKKHAGVGLARKILMDEGVRLFALAENKEGILAAMDGDSTVAPNYFQAIDDFFRRHPKLEAASIHYEHPLPKNERERRAIIQYELHLRYFVEAQKMAGLPTAYQTIGSSMAVRQSAYQLQGGMNRRKAGEDFYFLQKFARKGTLGNLNETTVYPSARISDRVPFGTGRAMGRLLASDSTLDTHALIIFDQIKLLLDGMPAIWNYTVEQIEQFRQSMPPAVQAFLAENGFLERVLDAQKNTASPAAFLKRFYNWFDGFTMMKYVHFARDHYYPDEPIDSVAHQFATREWGYKGQKEDILGLLEQYRQHR
ncbi:MAG TPA: hypothetical protein ENK85_04105 [Saprospiraceae bacterium]|nr:hypothetical protein [Saprospiraceae bacterium]